MEGRRKIGLGLGSLAIVASCCGLIDCGYKPTSIVLEYEVDLEIKPGEIEVLKKHLVAAINSRLGKAGRAKHPGEYHSRMESNRQD